MIVFDLACICGFTFEGWFQDRQDFEKQQAALFLLCPECGSREIHKILSPIRISSNSDMEIPAQKDVSGSEPIESAIKALKTLQRFVEENFENVGTGLAAESLKIHYGVSEPRNIRGVTTESEERRLKEEGINLIKIPMPAKNDGLN